MLFKRIISKECEAAIIAAIKNAELRTSGEIRVHIQEKAGENVMQEAISRFEKLAMHNCAERNGILIFVAIKSRQFSIIGDKGIHEKVGESFWSLIADEMKKHFAQGNISAGIAAAVEKAGTELGKHFPRKADDKNELPDEISYNDK